MGAIQTFSLPTATKLPCKPGWGGPYTLALDETLPPNLTLFDLAVDPSVMWEEQRL